MHDMKAGRLSTAQTSVLGRDAKMGGKTYHKRSAQTNSTAMRHLLELFSAKNGSGKKENTYLASQSAALATMAALTDCQLKQS
jgi:hypothetical protein